MATNTLKKADLKIWRGAEWVLPVIKAESRRRQQEALEVHMGMTVLRAMHNPDNIQG